MKFNVIIALGNPWRRRGRRDINCMKHSIRHSTNNSFLVFICRFKEQAWKQVRNQLQFRKIVSLWFFLHRQESTSTGSIVETIEPNRELPEIALRTRALQGDGICCFDWRLLIHKLDFTHLRLWFLLKPWQQKPSTELQKLWQRQSEVIAQHPRVKCINY